MDKKKNLKERLEKEPIEQSQSRKKRNVLEER